MNTKEELLAEIARSRDAIARDFLETTEAVDPRLQAARLYRRSPYFFLGAAAALGWIVAGPRKVSRAAPRRSGKQKRVPREEAASRKSGGIFGMLVTLVRLIVPVIKPALSAYAAKRLSELAKGL